MNKIAVGFGAVILVLSAIALVFFLLGIPIDLDIVSPFPDIDIILIQQLVISIVGIIIGCILIIWGRKH